MSVVTARRLFTVSEYRAMGRAGILAEDDRVELLEGEIVKISPVGSKHSGCVKFLNRFFATKLSGKGVVGIQDPVRLGEMSEPEPDVSILKFRVDDYRSKIPGPQDVLLLIEVADSSVNIDRQKAFLYANANILEYWIVNLIEEQIEVYTAPSENRYQNKAVFQRGDTITPKILPNMAVEVNAVLG